MTDYLGNEIHEGDLVLFNDKASRGYYSYFSTGKWSNLMNHVKDV